MADPSKATARTNDSTPTIRREKEPAIPVALDASVIDMDDYSFCKTEPRGLGVIDTKGKPQSSCASRVTQV